MITIEKNTDDNFAEIRSIAFEVWPVAYGKILSREQLTYMLDMMYNTTSLQQQAKEKQHHFILVKDNNHAVGFASYEFNCEQTGKTKIHKIYILSTQQGKGLGKTVIAYIERQAQEQGDKALFLNVNKNKPAQFFYKNAGFTIAKEEVIDIGQGYVMDDYVMEKQF